jgi:hypothetical protein
MVNTDFNGIVFFDPSRLRARYGGRVAAGTDLFTRYTTTDEGDDVLGAGLILPLLAMDDGGYEVIVRSPDEAPSELGELVVENGVYALGIEQGLVVADLAVLKDWEDDLGWQDCKVAPGEYAVTIRGFRQVEGPNRRIVRAGFELCLERVATRVVPTADLARNLRLFW